MEEKIESVLRLERMAFEEIRFNRDTAIPLTNAEYEMNFNRNVGISEDRKHFAVKLTLNLWSKIPNQFQITVSLIGYFFCECEDENLRESLIKYNTLSILFPYIRSQVSLITAQPDITPIVLPPVNVVGLFEEVDKQEPQVEEPKH